MDKAISMSGLTIDENGELPRIGIIYSYLDVI